MPFFDRALRRKLANAYGLFAVAFIAFLVLLAILSDLGLRDGAIGILFAIVTIGIAVVIGALARTMEIGQFLVAGHAVPPAYNGMATAAAFLSSAVFLGLAGAYFESGGAALALVIGSTLGLVSLAVFIAPYFRKSGAATVPDFLALRFGDGAIRFAALVIVVATSFTGLAAVMAVAGFVIALFLGVSTGAAMVIALAAILAATLFGGMRGVTLTAIAQAIVFTIAFLAPLVILSVRDYGLPIPHLTYGYALQEIGRLLGEGGATSLTPGRPSRFLFLPALQVFNLFPLILAFAAGTASLPQLVIRSATVPTAGAARQSIGWALLVTLVVATAAPAYAAFAKLAILKDLVGADVDALPDWVFTFGRLGLVRICGIEAASLEAVRAACAEPALRAADIAVGADTVVLAFPAIVNLPPIMTALVAAGGLAAALAAASALLFAAGGALGHDLYFRLLARNASAGRRLIVTRLILIAVATLAAWLAATGTDAIFALGTVSLSFSASGIFPVLVLGIWWKRCTRPGALAGMATGFAVSGLSIALAAGTGVAPWGPLGFGGVAGTSLAGAVFGMAIGFLAAIGVSLATKRPSKETEAIVWAIRRPQPRPEFEDRAA
jgi:cation/acetate symporter